MHKLKGLIRKIFPKALLKATEKSYRKGRGLFWQARYGFPARGMRVIAVTGTNGKTTTISYINEILKAAGYKTAALNTVFYEVAGKRTPNTTHYTINKQSIVQSFFARAKKARVDFVVLEVTSHALDQDRIMGVPVEIAVVTNLTQEHLDYHKTMENYAAAKALLLSDYGAKYAILNSDDKWFDYFRSKSQGKVISFGKNKSADIKICEVKLSDGTSSAKLLYKSEKINAKTALTGEFNLYNATAAAATGLILGINHADIERGIGNLSELSGRMERINEGQNFKVFIDFAITPDAIEKALIALKKTNTGKIRIVFGATGDRDREKRPEMGKTAAKLADAIYLTDDETYREDPETIRQAVLKGVEKAGGMQKTKVIADREKAISEALRDSKKGDAVLIAGLGHEDSRNMGGKLVPWSDSEITRKLLKN